MGGQKIHSIKPKAISQAFGFVEYIFAARRLLKLPAAFYGSVEEILLKWRQIPLIGDFVTLFFLLFRRLLLNFSIGTADFRGLD
jgi:hypothetical protein